MDIGDDECHWCGTPVFDPVHSRPEFGEYLAGTKLLCCSIVMVVGEDPGEQVDDRGIALMAVQTDMAAGRHDRAAETITPSPAPVALTTSDLPSSSS